MNIKKITITATLLLFAATSSMHAQGYTIDWSALSGGGGTSSGGSYRLSGTIAQPSVGFLSSATYDLLGGFWAALECPAAPSLEARWEDGQFVVWLASRPGTTYCLEYKTSLNHPSWTRIPSSCVTATGSNTRLVDTTVGGIPMRFYRVVALP